jgi:hypothetical protein
MTAKSNSLVRRLVYTIVATAIAGLPTGCSGETPVTSTAPTCTSFTYSNWGPCQSDNTQIRTIITSSPSGCAGGSPAISQACTYVPIVIPKGYIIDDTTFYPIPAIAKPAKGVPFKDPVFKTDVVRITDAVTELADQYNFAYSGYPKHDIENADGTILIIQAKFSSSWQFYNANPPYQRLGEIPSSLIGNGSQIDARWDCCDPDVLYYQYHGKMWQYSVSKKTAVILYDFQKDFPPTYYDPLRKMNLPNCGNTMQEEGNSSADSRYWAFNIYCYDPLNKSSQGSYYTDSYVVFDKTERKIIASRKRADIEANVPGFVLPGFVTMTPSGKYVWMGDAHRIFSRDLTTMTKPAAGLSWGHAAAGWNDTGREVIFGQGPKGTSKEQWLVMYDIEDGTLTYLAKLTENQIHNSANSTKPWGIVSSFRPTYPKVETRWGEHEVYMVELTRRTSPAPHVWRLAHTHTVYKAYDGPFAKINKKGTKIWFSSGWGYSSIDIDPATGKKSYDVYQINIPTQ